MMERAHSPSYSGGFTMLVRLVLSARLCDPPASASQCAGITGVSHRTQQNNEINGGIPSSRLRSVNNLERLSYSCPPPSSSRQGSQGRNQGSCTPGRPG
ncbi:hypothetical protein AAY473_015134 [Plecturocebus cupreus]